MTHATLSCLALALLLSFCIGFKPNEAGHVGITDEALIRLGFCPQARDSIENANVLTDIFEQLVAEAHFDDESLRPASQRLLNKRSSVISLIDRAVENADEYEVDDDSFFDFLPDLFPDLAADFLQLFYQANGGPFILGTSNAQTAAWTALGEALHSLQDFYSHSNWLEMGNAGRIHPDLGRRELSAPPADSRPCPTDPAVLSVDGTILTTGYFDFNPSKHCALAELPGKCRHGWNVAGCASGLNKDESSRPGYTEARALAVEATARYVQDILDDLASKSATHVNLFKGGVQCDSSLRNETLVFVRSSTLTSSCATFPIEFDNTGTRYQLTANLANYESITLRNPSGQPVTKSTSGVKEINDNDDDDHVVYSFDRVTAGTYQMEMCGSRSTAYQVVLSTVSDLIAFNSYFTRDAGIRNSGDFPLTENQQPLRGQNQLFMELVGSGLDLNSLRVSFVSLDGSTKYQSFAPTPSDSSTDRIKFLTSVKIDNARPFRILVEGRYNNQPFIRVFRGREYTPQYLDVQYISPVSTFQVGPDANRVSLDFSLTNIGTETKTYDIRVTATGINSKDLTGSVTTRRVSMKRLSHDGTVLKSITGSSVSLAAGESAEATVDMQMKNLDDNDVVQLTFRATSSGESHQNAVDVVGQYVSCRGDPICGGRGTCTPNSNKCRCFSPTATGSQCTEPQAGSPNPSFDSFSPFSPITNSRNRDSSSATLVVAFLGLTALALLL